MQESDYLKMCYEDYVSSKIPTKSGKTTKCGMRSCPLGSSTKSTLSYLFQVILYKIVICDKSTKISRCMWVGSYNNIKDNTTSTTCELSVECSVLCAWRTGTQVQRHFKCILKSGRKLLPLPSCCWRWRQQRCCCCCLLFRFYPMTKIKPPATAATNAK